MTTSERLSGLDTARISFPRSFARRRGDRQGAREHTASAAVERSAQELVRAATARSTGPGLGAPPPGRPGWDHWGGSWSQPPAAKPGIIPLRPLGVGEILDGAVTTMRAHWRTVLGISLAVAVVVQLVATVVNGLWLADASNLDALTRDPQPSPDELMDAMTGSLRISGVRALVETLGTVLATAMLTIVVSRAVLGRSVSAGEAWRDSRPQLLRLLGLLFLSFPCSSPWRCSQGPRREA
ncbi:hypothetical protein [Streptomyces marispadix]|uniref:hypothetical protein n=1 Tax=Streptomyces marispadix TaxID=2922868 RepID=UPI0027E35DE7|nr:hypothetical protein [Streptomyces marispadix]